MERTVPFILTLLALVYGSAAFAQTETKSASSLEESSELDLQQIAPVQDGLSAGSYYKVQQQVWQAQLTNDKANANAWLNYYKAFRYEQYTNVDRSLDLEAQRSLDGIVEQMNINVPNSFETHYVNYWNSSEKLNAAKELEAANSLAPDRNEIYDDLIGLYEMQGNATLKSEFCKKLNASGTIPENVMTYNANALNSVEQNGVLITNGYDDTWPAMIQQEVNAVRKDVKVVQLELMQEDQYRNKVANELGISSIPSKEPAAIVDAIVKADRSVYLGLTLPPEVIIKHQDKLYMTGLALRYSEIPMDNASVLKENWKRMDTEHIENWKPTGDRRQDDLMRNYVVPLAVLEDIYASEGNEKESNKLGRILDRSAGDSGKQKKLRRARAVNTY